MPCPASVNHKCIGRRIPLRDRMIVKLYIVLYPAREVVDIDPGCYFTPRACLGRYRCRCRYRCRRFDCTILITAMVQRRSRYRPAIFGKERKQGKS